MLCCVANAVALSLAISSSSFIAVTVAPLARAKDVFRVAAPPTLRVPVDVTILVVPKLVSWQKNNIFLAAGWYFGFLVKATKSATKDRINKFDHGVFVEMAITTPMKLFFTRFGFKLYIGLKRIFKDWNEDFSRIGSNKGYNFTVHFYTSFIYGIL